MNRTLLFLHIPKTAGMSLTNLFRRITDDNERWELYDPAHVIALRDLPHSAKAQLRIVYGHFQFGLHEVLPQPTEYFTFLRDPIDRIVSDYFHVERHPSSAIHHVAGQRSLLDFAKYRVFEQGLTNRMTRQISGYYGLEEEWPDADTVQYQPLPEEALEIANQNLERHFGVVGLTSCFDETMLLLKRQWHWPTVRYVKRNIGTNRTSVDLTDKFRQFIYDHHPLDIQLYERWSRQFQQTIEQQGLAFQQQLERYRQVNQLYSTVMSKPTVKRIHRRMPKQMRKYL